MSVLKMCLLVAGVVVLLFFLLSPVDHVAPSFTLQDEQLSESRFFNFDRGATFAEMLAEPPHNIYGSSISLWVYRTEGLEAQEAEIAELLLTGHAASKVCMRGSIAVYEAALALPPQESDLVVAGATYFQGITPEQRAEIEKAPSVKQYKIIKNNLDKLRSQRDVLSHILSGISAVVLLDDSMLILALAYGDDTPLRIKICFLQGFVSGGLSMECDQLLEQASVPIEEAHHELAHFSSLIGRFPDLRTLMANYLDTLDRLLQAGQKHPWSVILDPELLAEVEEARQAVENWFGKTFTSLAEQAEELALNLDKLAREEAVREYLRSQSLDDLVNAFKRLEAESGLVTVKELDPKIVTDTRAMIEQWLQYATSIEGLDEPLIIWYQPPAGQEGAILLPFYYTGQYSGFPGYLTIELSRDDFPVPDEVLRTHQEALVDEVKGDAQRRKEFYQSQLKDLENIQKELQGANPYQEIPIYCRIDFEKLQRECQREPIEWVTVKEYLLNPAYLPGMIETAERLLAEVEMLLQEIEEATEAQGRLDHINRAVVLDSFLRDWDLAFISRDQGAAYDAWREKGRTSLWTRIDQELQDRGIEAKRLKHENVIFDVSFEDNHIRIVPYFIANISNLVFVIDPRAGIVEYIHPWGRRDKVKVDLDRMPQEVKAALETGKELETRAREARAKEQCEKANQDFQKAIEKYQETRELLAQPLIEKTQKALEQGESQVAVETLKRALVIDPRGTSQWLIAEWKGRQVDTASRLKKIQGECIRASDERPDYCSFLDGKKLFSEGKYFEALGEYRKALSAGLAFNELYQSLIDTYWELGMYKRALETAFLQLDDALQGLRLEGKPLSIANNRLRFPFKSGLRYENADLKTMQVEVQGKNLVVRVNQQEVLEITSPRADDITYLAQWFKALDPDQVSNIGDTAAERLLNTNIGLFPAEAEFARLFLSADEWGPVGQQLLKAMVYGSVKPSFISDSVVEEYLYPDLCSVERKGDESGLLPHARAVSRPELILGTRDYLYDSFWSSSEIIEAIEYPDTREKIRDEIINEIPGQLVAGNADGLAAALGILQGSLGQQLSPDVRLALLADARALNKLGARVFFTDYPQITMLDVNVQGNPVYLLVLGEGSAMEAIPIQMKGQDLMGLLTKLRESVTKDPAVEVTSLIEALTHEERDLIRDKLVLPMVEHLSPQVEGDRIILDLKGRNFALLDLPNDRLIRGLVAYYLAGNRIVGISAHSTARDIAAKLPASIDPRKLKLVFSLPWSKINELREPYRTSVIDDYRDHFRRLQEEAQVLGIEVIDLSDVSAHAAKAIVDKLLREKGSLVLTFWEAGERSLEIGQKGLLVPDDVPEAAVPLPDRLLALSGCDSYGRGWPDIVIGKQGVLSLGFWKDISIADAFLFADRLVGRLKAELTANPDVLPQAVPLLLDILEGLPGFIVVELPPGGSLG